MELILAYWWGAPAAVAGLVVLIALYSSVVYVGGMQVAVVERMYFGTKMLPGRIIAMSDEIGVQARTMGPGLHFLIPFIYRVEKSRVSFVEKNQVGLIEAFDGNPIPAGRMFAKSIKDHNMFQEGEAFLLNGGQKGLQTAILPPGPYRINWRLFKFSTAPWTEITEDEIGVVESSDGDPIPPGQIFAKMSTGHQAFQDADAFLNNDGQKGPQLDVIPPGQYRINPLLFTVTTVPTTRIGRGQVGMVTAVDGAKLADGRLLGRRVAGHSNFEKGDVFLANGGQKGPQIDILQPGTYRINPKLFKVEVANATVIPAQRIGQVTALDGSPMPEREFVARSVSGHDNYQDATAFLDKGGQRGPQFDVLRPGTYYVNPLMFQIELDDVAQIERGQVAVIVSNVGDEPPDVQELVDQTAADEAGTNAGAKPEERLKSGIERYVVPKGFRGIQRDVAGPGTYYLNRRAYKAYIVDTTNITIDWDQDDRTKFDPLQVISKDGFPISVSVKVVIRVRPDQAPYMVAKIGSIENLILHVIHPMIDSSFRNQASSTSAMNFMQDRQEEQRKAEERARGELEKYHVECVSVLICQIILPQELMETQTTRIIAEQQRAMYQEQQKAEKERIEQAKTKAEADQQASLVTAEMSVKIAGSNKQKTITEAEADAEKRVISARAEGEALKTAAEGRGEASRLEKEGEAAGIAAVGLAKGKAAEAEGVGLAEGYKQQAMAIGGEGIVAMEIAKQIAAGKIKLTPDFLIQGAGSGSGTMADLVAALLVKQLAGEAKKSETAAAP